MIKRINVEQLKIGMYITDLNNQWIPDNNLKKSGIVKYDRTIDQIRLLDVDELYIDTEKGEDCEDGIPLDILQAQQKKELDEITRERSLDVDELMDVSEEFAHASKVHEQAKELVTDILDDIKEGNAIDVKQVEEVSDELIHSVQANKNALLTLSRIREKDEYLFEHSVNVGVLMAVLARGNNITGTRLKELVTGALLHDVGKILVPIDILNKPGKLTPVEWEEMKRHVQYGERVLGDTPGLSEISKAICSQHHERCDGSGYPRKLHDDQISVFGRMAAVVDVYDAITSDRCYHAGMDPHNALKKLIEWSAFHLDKDTVYDFIRSISVYPIGTVVELDDHSAAIVVEANHGKQNLPKLKVFFDINKHEALDPYVLDLENDNRQGRRILATLDPKAIGFTTAELLRPAV